MYCTTITSKSTYYFINTISLTRSHRYFQISFDTNLQGSNGIRRNKILFSMEELVDSMRLRRKIILSGFQVCDRIFYTLKIPCI